LNQGYRPDIDGLRAVAILPVVIFHANLGCPGGFVGVDVFFVISGFLITSLILKEIHTGSFSIMAFWERRIRRILPALALVVLASLVGGWFFYFPIDFNFLGKSVVAQTFLSSNIFFWLHTGYFASDNDTKPLLHTWSLAVEEQFYLLFPLLLLLLARQKRFSTVRGIAWVAAISFALNVAGTHWLPSAAFYLLPGRAWELMVGAFLAAIPESKSRNWQLNEAIAISGVGLILFSVACYSNATKFPGLAALPPCLGTALIIFAGSAAKPTWVGRMLSLKPVVFVGLISYSLYLWHWPLLVFAQYNSTQIDMGPLSRRLRAALLLASALLAVLSWKWVEMPFRKRRLCARRPQIFAFAAGTALTLVLLGLTVYWKQGMPFRLPEKALVFESYRGHYAFRNETTVAQAAAGTFPQLGVATADRPVEVLIWGDSHAMALAPVIDELCRRYAVRGVEATHSSTAPILDYSSHASIYSLHEDSQAFGQSVVDFVVKNHVKAVIITAQWCSYEPSELVGEKLAETVKTLRAAGASVYVVKDVPCPGYYVPRVAALTVLHHGDVSRLDVSPEKYAGDNKDYDPIFAHLDRVGAKVLDPSKYLLNERGRYDVIRGDKVLYFDYGHLTVEGAELLAPMFEPVFRGVGKG
jgi:peptidoglycan/LPS O-acetylase OafA/YrhL